jgi:hypothetical protein
MTFSDTSSRSAPWSRSCLLPSAFKPRLFRPDISIAAGAAGRRNHPRIAGIWRRCTDFRINARGRAQDAVRPRQLVAERLGALAALRAIRHNAALRRRLRWRAVNGARGRGCCRLCWWCRRGRRSLCARHAGPGHHHTCEKDRCFHPHLGKRSARAKGSQKGEPSKHLSPGANTRRSGIGPR